MTATALTVPNKKPSVQELMRKVEDNNLSFAARLTSVGDVMRATAHQMMAALPRHVTADRMIRVSLNAIRKNPKLLECKAASLFGAITEAATYGWEIGGILGHAYLVPFKDEAQLIPGYKGLIDLCRRSGQVSTIQLEVVHEGDHFNYTLGDEPRIEHQPNDRDPQRDSKPITHVYAVVKLRDGGIQRSVWSREKIDAHKEQYSQAWRRAETSKKRDSFWHTAWPAAAKKTVIRDMIQRGLLPVSAEYQQLVDRGVKHDGDEMMSDLQIDMLPPDSPMAIEGTVEGEAEETHDRPQTAVEHDSDMANLIGEELDEAGSVGNCNAIKDHFLPLCKTEADRTLVIGRCEAKAAEINGSRGERSNKKGQA